MGPSGRKLFLTQSLSPVLCESNFHDFMVQIPFILSVFELHLCRLDLAKANGSEGLGDPYPFLRQTYWASKHLLRISLVEYGYSTLK